MQVCVCVCVCVCFCLLLVWEAGERGVGGELFVCRWCWGCLLLLLVRRSDFLLLGSNWPFIHLLVRWGLSCRAPEQKGTNSKTEKRVPTYCLSDLFVCQGAAICGMNVRTSHLSSVPATKRPGRPADASRELPCSFLQHCRALPRLQPREASQPVE